MGDIKNSSEIYYKIQEPYEEILDNSKVQLLNDEFSRLKGSCYLDHAGATLYGKSQIEAAKEELQSNLFSNPHSRNPSSSFTTDATDNVRQRILQHFETNEDEYTVIFTSGTTAALKLVAESFSLNGGIFAYLEETHTSVIGMREYLMKKRDEPKPPKLTKDSSVCSSSSLFNGGNDQVYCISKAAMEEIMNMPKRDAEAEFGSGEHEHVIQNSLFAMPAQCNFSGFKFPLEWISKIQSGGLDNISKIESFYLDEKIVGDKLGNSCLNDNEKQLSNWFVLLDAASYVASNKLDLSLYKPDFVTISFYKIFGWPTGIGALLVRNKSKDTLGSKQYFGGGTVNISLPSRPFHVKRDKLNERFEDGTISFLSILGLRHGFDILSKLFKSMDAVRRRTFLLTQYLYRNLSNMKYSNGQQVVRIYSDTSYESEMTQGPVLTFNLLRPNGDIIGYSEMEQIAYLHDVHLRYGCFCNPGACRRHLELTNDQVLKHFEAGHVCGDMRDIIDGHPTGAIRVSLGYMTPKENVEFLLQLIFNCWIKPYNVSQESEMKKAIYSRLTNQLSNYYPNSSPVTPKRLVLDRIFVYPIKSCAPFEVKNTWTLGTHGLLFDREWLIVNSNGVPLQAKREPRLCLIQPIIDISSRKLLLHYPGDCEDVSVPLDYNPTLVKTSVETPLCNSKVCGDSVVGIDCGFEVSSWLCRILDKTDVKLIRMSPDHYRKPRNSLGQISLANQSQFLLLSMTSLKQLARELISNRLLSSFNIPTKEKEDENETFSNLGKNYNSSIAITNLNYDDENETESSLKGATSMSEIDTNRLLNDSENLRKKQNETNIENVVIENLIGRFRGNFVVDNVNSINEPYEEELWKGIQIGGTSFKSGGPCIRCATICMDPKTASKSSEPLLTLSRTRGGRPYFGVHLYAHQNLKKQQKDSTNNVPQERQAFLQALRIGDHCQVLEEEKLGENMSCLEIIENID